MNTFLKVTAKVGAASFLICSVLAALQLSVSAQEYWSLTEEKVAKAAKLHWTTKEITQLLEVALPGSGATDPKVTALEELAMAVSHESALPDGFEEAILEILQRPEAGITAPTAQIVGMLKLEAARSELESWATGADSASGVAALRALVALGGEETRHFLRKLYALKCEAPDIPEHVEGYPDFQPPRANILGALIDLDPAGAAQDVVAHFSKFPEDRYNKKIFEMILSREGGPAALTQALVGKRLSPSVAKTGVDVANAMENTPEALVEALTKASATE